MPNFKLYAVNKLGELEKIDKITDQILNLQRIDSITRKYGNAKEAINDFVNKGYINSGAILNDLVITYNKNHEVQRLKPLYKESYQTKQNSTVYDQVFAFANDIKDIHEKCIVFAGKDTRTYIDKVNARMAKYRYLTKPSFFEFAKELFIKWGYFKDCTITEDMKETASQDTPNGKRMAHFIEKIREDQAYLGYIDRFKEYALDNNGNIIGDTEDLYDLLSDFNTSLLAGFYRMFVTSTGNFNYTRFREFYREYYEHFISPYIIEKKNEEKPSKVTFRTINTDSGYKYVLENNASPITQRPVSINRTPEYTNDNSYHYTIEEAHLFNDEYFPDEMKKNNTPDRHIAYNEDGTYVDKEDEAYMRIK